MTTQTTMETTFDIDQARQTLQRRAARRRQRLGALEQTAHQDVRVIVEILISRYRPKRIYQWGSLLHPGRFREWSDIDIALEGLSDPLDGLRAADAAGDVTRFPVDLVELDRIDPRHARDIRNEGRLLYEEP